ncbi:hypothetical protein L3X38_036723 [Prunus dulcis]|uniref:Aminotransferase-like plant mobile domain-containing protein n=1 Tax=Prunus dulcis TaxID=3755 RepID=A0AAD4YPP6_PRUDU|nr:hypothetical protein L3X38_036723 [Prunus dulcis]
MGVLDAIFLSKACDIHVEAKMLCHVVRRWSAETNTFICLWGEFTPTLKDVANIFHLPICGCQDPLNVALTQDDKKKLEILWKGASTAPSTSLRFSIGYSISGMPTGMSCVMLPHLNHYGLGDSSSVIFLKIVCMSWCSLWPWQ